MVDAFPASARQLGAAPPFPANVPLVVIAHGVVEEPELEGWWQREQSKSAARSSCGREIVAERSRHHVTEDRPDLVVASILELLQATR
jgi:hypothetical protein